MTTNLSENMQGAFLMAACMASFAINDALIKSSSAFFPLVQAIFLRSLFTTGFLGIMAIRKKVPFRVISKADWKLIGLRSFGEVIGAFLFLYAVFNMPLANATAILQSLPLAVTVGAAVFLKEPVGWRRYIAVLIGFTGVMIIVRPGTEGFTSISFFALSAVVFIMIRDLSTRRISRTVPSFLVSFITSVCIMGVSGIAALFIDWTPVTWEGMSILFAASIFVIAGYILSVSSVRIGEVGFVSPFRYTILIFSMILSITIFGDVPDFWMLLGSSIVVATGIYTFYRERKVKHLA
jgi:drug/metabolite transporter (DMT)-like permease